MEKNVNEIKIDDLVSVPFGTKFLMGIVRDVNQEKITIENYNNNQLKVPNNSKIYKFFPGQKFDLREFNSIDQNSKEKLSLSERLNKFLSKTEVGGFENLMKNYKKDLVHLLKGELTNSSFKGQSIKENELKDWECKFQIYRGEDGFLKMNTAWKQEQLNTKVYGVELTPKEIENAMTKKQTIVIERTNSNNDVFKAFCKYDEKLNSFTTSQYSEKVAELMKKSYSNKEAQTKSQSETIEDIKPKEKKGRKI